MTETDPGRLPIVGLSSAPRRSNSTPKSRTIREYRVYNLPAFDSDPTLSSWDINDSPTALQAMLNLLISRSLFCSLVAMVRICCPAD